MLKNKYYFDEIYHFLFVKPADWIAEKFTSLFMDQVVIDGILHSLARFSLFLGHAFRNYFDKPVINEFIGDGTGKVVKASGSGLRKIQAGRVQYYMVVSIVVLVIFAFLYYFLSEECSNDFSRYRRLKSPLQWSTRWHLSINIF